VVLVSDIHLLLFIHIAEFYLILRHKCLLSSAVGAIWGFSEVVGFRTPETVWFWRPTAQVFGAVFFARWVLELNTHLEKEEIFGRRSSSSRNSDAYGATEESKLMLATRGGDATEE
jgi:hypothetical protein